MESLSIFIKLVLALVLIAVLTIAVLYMAAIKSQKGAAPGLDQGKLQRCPSSPNCVVSETQKDPDHYTAPVSVSEPQLLTFLDTAESVVVAMGGRIVSRTDDYIGAEFKSSMFGFVDDFELRLDAERRLLHIRSASRVGYSDMGANRKRVASFRQLLSQT